MAEYKMVRLGDVCEIQSGGTPSRSKTEYWKDGTIPWVKIGDFSGKYLDKTTEHITQQGLDNSSAKLFSKINLSAHQRKKRCSRTLAGTPFFLFG